MPQTPVGCVACNVYLDSDAGKKRGRIIPPHVNGNGAGQSVPSTPAVEPAIVGDGRRSNGKAADTGDLEKARARGGDGD